MKRLQLTKKLELITPLTNIIPPLPPRTCLNKDSRSEHLSLLKQFTVIVFTAILIIACNATESNEAKTSSQTEITVTEIPKRATTDVRDSYVLFTIEANKNLSNYHLAVKEKGEIAPTTTEMTSGALKRNLGTEPINVLIAQRLNAPMVTFAKQYFADNAHRTLGTDMIGASWDTDFAMILDKTASGSNAWVAESVLEPSTQYTLYGMNKGGNTVTELLTLATDIDSSSITGATSGVKFIDTTLEAQRVEISVHADEYYIFPLQSHSTNAFDSFDVIFSGQAIGNITIFLSSMAVGGFIDAGYHHQLLMFTQKSTDEETLKKGAYVLMSTSQMNNKASPLNFGTFHTFTSGVTTSIIMFSHLNIQE